MVIVAFLSPFILVAVLVLITWLVLHRTNPSISVARVAASIVGIYAGLIGAGHGYYEILQRDKVLNGIIFDAISGTTLSTLPTSQWTGWPAMAFIPNLLLTGILASIVSLAVMAWAAAFVQRKNGGLLLILLSALMLLVGGGFIPPLLGIIAGLIGTRLKSR
jgi:hypothetical protein